MNDYTEVHQDLQSLLYKLESDSIEDIIALMKIKRLQKALKLLDSSLLGIAVMLTDTVSLATRNFGIKESSTQHVMQSYFMAHYGGGAFTKDRLERFERRVTEILKYTQMADNEQIRFYGDGLAKRVGGYQRMLELCMTPTFKVESMTLLALMLHDSEISAGITRDPRQ